MASPITKDHLDAVAKDLARHFNESIGMLRKHVDERFTQIDNRLDREFPDIHTKLDAIMSGEILVTRKQPSRLLLALKSRGIELNEEEIFAA